MVKLTTNLQSFILAPPYPESWLGMILFQYSTTLKIASQISSFAASEINSAPSKDTFFGDWSKETSTVESEEKSKQELWKQFFRLGVFLIQSKTLNAILAGGAKYGTEAKQKEITDKYKFKCIAV